MSGIDFLPGSQYTTRKQTWKDAGLHLLGKPEEMTVALLRLKNPFASSNLYSRTGFSEWFTQKGMDPRAAALLGMAAAIANPLDILNKLGIGQYTKLGKLSKVITGAEDVLKAGEDGIKLIDKAGLLSKIDELKKLKDTSKVADVVASATKSLVNLEDKVQDLDALNEILKAAQKSGKTIEDLQLGGSLVDQIKKGQRSLIGFSSPLSADHLRLFGLGRGYLDDATVISLPRKLEEKLATGLVGSKNLVGESIGEAAKRVTRALGLPEKTEASMKARSAIEAAAKHSAGSLEEKEALFQNTINTLIKEGVKVDQLDEVLQAVEWPEHSTKQLFIKAIEDIQGEFLDDTLVAKPAHKISTEQGALLTPSGITDEEIPLAMQQWNSTYTFNRRRIGKSSRHSALLTDRYVVVNPSSQKGIVGPTDELDGIFGQRQWVRHTQDNQTFLVAKRLPFSKVLSKSSDLNVTHLQNLEKVAAQLAAKRKAIVGLHHTDLLVSPNGGVQIINPDVIQDVAKVREAVQASSLGLTELAQSMGMQIPQFPHLSSPAAAKSVAKGLDSFSYRTPESIDGGNYAATSDLLTGAGNTSVHHLYIDAAYGNKQAAKALGEVGDFEYVNGIERLRKEYRKAISEGKNPYIQPIEIYRDDRGALFIRDGLDRLTAAELEGIEVVPIKELQLFGEAVKPESTVFIGSAKRLKNVWASDGEKTLTITANNQRFELPYRLVKPDGTTTVVNVSDLEVDKKFASSLLDLLGAGPAFASSKAMTTRWGNIQNMLLNKFGSVELGMTHIADIAEQSDNVTDFISAIKPIFTDEKLGISLPFDNALTHAFKDKFFTRVKNAATKSLDSLAANGFLTPRGINIDSRVRLASELNNHLFQRFDAATNTLTFHSNTEQLAGLRKKAVNYFSATTPAHEVEPLANIHLSGIDGTEDIKVKDLVSGEHPLARSIITGDPKQFKLGEEFKNQLKAKGIYVLSGGADDADTIKALNSGMTKGVLLFKEGKDIERPTISYFVTASGDVVVGLAHDNVSDLFKDVYGQGNPIFQEFGVATGGRIFVNNPFGGVIKKLSAGHLSVLEDRLKLLAEKFKKLGFSESTVLDVNSPLDSVIWRSMYGERVTIHDVLKDNFKLNIPDELKGHAPDISIVAPSRYLSLDPSSLKGSVAVTQTRLANESLQRVVDFVKDTGDETFINEALANLPVAYHESYFGRNVTKPVREALQDAYLKYPHKESKSFKNFESFFKGRVITDLTTLEVNQILKRLQKEKGLDPNEIIADVVKEYRNGYKIAPNPEQAHMLEALSQLMPSGAEFFITNPIYGSALRYRQSVRAITRSELVDSLKANGVTVWSGGVSDLRKASIAKNTNITEIDKAVEEIDAALIRNRDRVAQLEKMKGLGDEDAKKLLTKIDEMVMKKQKLLSQKLDYIDRAGKKELPSLVVDLGAEEAWISGERAMKLINSGTISPSDINGSLSDALVKIDIKKYASQLEASGTEIMLFPPEVAKEVSRYFAATKREGFDKFLGFWDEVHATWRAWTLFPIPSYHIRNAVSSAFMSWLGGVNDPSVYRASFKINSLMTSFRDGKLSTQEVQEALSSIQFANSAGKVVTGEDIWSNFVRLGGIHGGLNRNEFGRFGNLRRASEFEHLASKAGISPSSEMVGSWMHDNSVLRSGVSAASYIENRFRLAAFIHAWKNNEVVREGKTVLTGFDAAMMFVKKVHYDYSDLSMFERSVLTRVFPFYAWSRHNIPRMMTTLLTDPVKHYRIQSFITSLERGVTGGPVDEDSIPDWIKEKYGMIVGKDDKGRYLIKTTDGFLPVVDAFKLLSGRGITGALQDGVTPFLKVPYEQLANYSLYTKQAIEQYPGQRARSFTLGEFGFSRRSTNQGPLGVLNLVLNEAFFRSMFRPGGELITKVIDPLFDPSQHGDVPSKVISATMDLAIGRAYTVDPDKTLAAIYRDWTRNKSTLVSMLRNAEERGATNEVDDIQSKLTWLTLNHPGNEK